MLRADVNLLNGRGFTTPLRGFHETSEVRLSPVGGVVRALALLSVHVPDVVRILLLELVEAHDLREYTLVDFQPVCCRCEARREEHVDEN